MAKLIDVDELWKHKFKSASERMDLNVAYMGGWNDAIDTIMSETPTVDAVPVVRCKDCKWWKTNYSWNGNEHKICVMEAYEPLRKPEDFCSRGERK